MKVIRFRRLNPSQQLIDIAKKIGVDEIWEIAFNQEHLNMKLNGETAEVIMPAKPLIIRIWRYFFPLHGIEMTIERG